MKRPSSKAQPLECGTASLEILNPLVRALAIKAAREDHEAELADRQRRPRKRSLRQGRFTNEDE